MAKNDNNELIFPMGINVNMEGFKRKWAASQELIQETINKSKFSIKVDIDHDAVKSMLEAMKQLQKLQGDIAKNQSKSTPAAMLKSKTIAEAKAAEIALLAEAKARDVLSKSESAAAIGAERLLNVSKQGVGVAARSQTAIVNESIAQEKLARSKLQTAVASQKATTATHGHTEAYRQQSSIVNGLTMMLKSYVSVFAMFRFSTLIRDTTAEFEMQRVALGAIIQDRAKANSLFSEIVELGIKSPFQIKELITYTKQLAAYRIETDSLFKSTSMLADISAGLGVSMDRLILAYGQVRAASVLRGQELRQFTEAGIPLVDLLSKKFTELKGEVVSTADVFELMRRRMIPFSMIDQIFKDMTEAGGIFYNMQEIQSRTLQGTLANLRDAYDKMYMEMGESQMALLKAVPAFFRSLADNWKSLFTVIATGGAIYGIHKVAVLASNLVMSKEANTLVSTTLKYKAKEASLLRQAAVYRDLSAAEASKIIMSNKLTYTDIQQLIDSKKLTKEIALRMIATKKLTYSQIVQIENSGLITRAESTQAMATSRLRLAYMTATSGIRTFIVSLKAATVAMLQNPYMWLMLGIGLLANQVRRISDRNAEYTKGTKEAVKQTKIFAAEAEEAHAKIKETLDKAQAVGATDDSIKRATIALQGIIDKNETLRPLVQARLKDVDDEAEKLATLLDIYGELQAAASGEGGVSRQNPYSEAVKSTGGWFKKDVVENMKELSAIETKISTLFLNMNAEGLKVYKIQDVFDKLSLSFRKGEIDIIKYREELNELFKSVKKTADASILNTDQVRPHKYWQRLKNNMSDLDGIMASVTKGSEKMFDFVKKNNATINESPVLWGADSLGLSSKNSNALKVRIASDTEMYLRATEGIQKDIFKNLVGHEFDIPIAITPELPTLNAYEKGYNALIEKLSKELPKIQIPLLEATSDDRDLSKESKTELDERLGLQKAYTIEVAAGNDFHKDQLERLGQEIKAYEQLARYTGNDITKKKGSAVTNPAIAALNREVQLIEQAYNEYEKLSEQRGASFAKKEISRAYQGQTELSLAFSPEGLQKSYSDAQSLFSKMGEKANADAWKMQLKGWAVEFKTMTDLAKAQNEATEKEIADALTLKQIWQSVVDYRLTGVEKEKAAIKAKYDREEQALAKLVGKRTVLTEEELEIQRQIRIGRETEEAAADLTESLRRIDVAERNEKLKNKISVTGQQRRSKLVELDFATYKKYELERIALLEKSSKAEDRTLALEKRQALIELIEVENSERAKTIEIVNGLVSALGRIGSTFQEMGGPAAKVGDIISSLGGSMNSLMTVLKKDQTKAEKGQSIAAGLDAIASIFGMIGSQIKANKIAQDAWTAAIMESVHQASLLRIEALAYQEANIFSVENPYARALAGADQYILAMKEITGLIPALKAGQVQTGTKKVASGKNMATGAMSGAVLGGIIGGPLAIVGAAIGAVAGFIVGSFVREVVPVFESLEKVYGQLFDPDTYELNDKILADYGKLDDATKKVIDNWKEIQAKAAEAAKEMDETFSKLSGDLGNGLRSALIDAWTNRDLYSAVDAFRDKVGDVIADIIRQMIFAQYFQDYFDSAEEGMRNSFGRITDEYGKVRPMTAEEMNRVDATGKKIYDLDIVDDIIRLGENIKGGVKGWGEAMDATDEVVRGLGFKDGLSAGQDKSDLTGLAKGYATASEESIVTLSGYANSQLYYQVAQYNVQQRILEIMEASVSSIAQTSGGSDVMTDLYNVQASALVQLQMIVSNTSRAAMGAENIYDTLNKLSLTGGKSINVKLIN